MNIDKYFTLKDISNFSFIIIKKILSIFLACFWMLDALLEYTTTGDVPTVFMDENQRKHKTVKTTSNIEIGELPHRMKENHFSRHSKVLISNEPAGSFRFLPLCITPIYAVPVPVNESVSM